MRCLAVHVCAFLCDAKRLNVLRLRLQVFWSELGLRLYLCVSGRGVCLVSDGGGMYEGEQQSCGIYDVLGDGLWVVCVCGWEESRDWCRTVVVYMRASKRIVVPLRGVCGRNFYDNMLSGSIPVELGLLTALTWLYVPPSLTRNLHVELAIRK